MEKLREHRRFFFSFICGTNDIVTHRELWNSLQTIALQVEDDSWIVLGDFNVVLDSSEMWDKL